MDTLSIPLLFKIAVKLRTCQEILEFSAGNALRVYDKTTILKDVIQERNKDVNVDAMIQTLRKQMYSLSVSQFFTNDPFVMIPQGASLEEAIHSLLCQVILDSSCSSGQDYIDGEGMYQAGLRQFIARSVRNREYIRYLLEFYNFLMSEPDVRLDDGRIVIKMFRFTSTLINDPDIQFNDDRIYNVLSKWNEENVKKFRNMLIKCCGVVSEAFGNVQYNRDLEPNNKIDFAYLRENIGRYIDIIVKLDVGRAGRRQLPAQGYVVPYLP